MSRANITASPFAPGLSYSDHLDVYKFQDLVLIGSYWNESFLLEKLVLNVFLAESVDKWDEQMLKVLRLLAVRCQG